MKEKLQKLAKSKYLYIGLGVIVVAAILILLINPSRAILTGKFSDQTVGELSFTNGTLTTENEESSYNVDVTNVGSSKKTLSIIEIHFKDGTGKEIETLYGYIGDSLEVKESKKITANIDVDISEAKSIEYIIK